MIISNIKYTKHRIYNWLAFYFKLLQITVLTKPGRGTFESKYQTFGIWFKMFKHYQMEFYEGKLVNSSTLINAVESVEEQ